MAFSAFFKLWAYLPKGLLIILATLFIVYFIGVSHGRAPYKQAIQNFQIKAKIIIKQSQKNQLSIQKKRDEAYEKLKSNICILNNIDANILSDIKP